MKTSTIAIISFCVIAFASCHKKSIFPVKGSGDSVSKTYNQNGFDRVALSIDADVDYTQDDVYYIEVYAQSNIHDELRIQVEGTELRIDAKKPLWKYKTVRIKIHSPNLYGVEMSGGGNFETQTPVNTNTMDIRISGSGSVALASLNTQRLNAELRGSGKLSIRGGSTIDQALQASGSGDIDVMPISSENSTVRLSGSGGARLHVAKRLDVHILGSGHVKYTGTPAINSEISGSGKLSNVN